jgi:hypothetical protein
MDRLDEEALRNALLEALEACDQFQVALSKAHDLGYHVSIRRTPEGALAIELRKEPAE